MMSMMMTTTKTMLSSTTKMTRKRTTKMNMTTMSMTTMTVKAALALLALVATTSSAYSQEGDNPGDSVGKPGKLTAEFIARFREIAGSTGTQI